MRSKISSAIADLNSLSAIYDWIPNEHTIRPTAEDLEVKRAEMDRISMTWPSVKDYVIHEIFGERIYRCASLADAKHQLGNGVALDYTNSVGEIFMGSELCSGEFIFEPSRFRYNLPSHSNHYILWSTVKPYWCTYDDHVVNDRISMQIKNIVGHDRYQFAWYKNPKPTIIDFWHVQVFWINLSS